MSFDEKKIDEINDFLASDKKCMFVTGTAMFQKHKFVMLALDYAVQEKSILIRIDELQHAPEDNFCGCIHLKKTPIAGHVYKLCQNNFEFDSMANAGTRNRTSNHFDYAIVYPTEALLLEGKLEPIKELFTSKKIGKIFLVTNRNISLNDYPQLQPLVDCELELNK